MRYTATQKNIFPNHRLTFDVSKKDYIINEMKRRIVLEMIEKLPFEVDENKIGYGTEYTVSLDVAIEGWDEFSRRIAPFEEKKQTNDKRI